MSRTRFRGAITYRRCDRCRNDWPDYLMYTLMRIRAPGQLQMCPECWWDFKHETDSGAVDRGALLERIAAARWGV